MSASPLGRRLHAGLRWLTARRWRVVAGALLVLAIVARAALPFALTWVIESRGTEILGRVVRVADIDLGLLAGAVRIEELSIGPIFAGQEPPEPDPDDEAHFLAERLTANWSWLALLRGEFRLEDLAVVAPKALLVRMPDGEMVPLRRPRPKAAPEPDEAGSDSGSGDPWPVRVDGLRVTDVGLIFVNRAIPGREPLQFEMEEFALTGLALEGDDLTLGRIGVEAPRLRVARDIDIAPFVGGGAPPPEAPAGEESAALETVAALEIVAEAAGDALEGAPPEPAPARTLNLANVSLERAVFTVFIEDGDEIESRISVSAQNVSLGEPFPLDLALELEGGTLAIRGDVGTRPVLFDGIVAWSDLPLARIGVIAGDRLPLRIASGSSSGELAVQARIANEPESGPSRIDVSGRAGVKGFAATRGGDALRITWSDLEVELASLALRPSGETGRPVPPQIEIAAVRLHEPTVAAILRAADPPTPEETEPVPTDPEELAGEAEPPADTPPPAASSEPRIRIASLTVTGGEVDFTDESVSPAHRSRLRDLTVEGRDLRLPEREAAQLRIAAEGPGDGSIRLDAAVVDGGGTIEFDVADLGLPAFSPYSAESAGYWVERGHATVATRVGVRDAGYDVDTAVSLDDLDVAEVTAGSFEKQFGLSLGLALALLRDPFGRISIPVSARVTPGETNIAVERIVLAALRQALVGALTSPLKGVGFILDAATGGGDEPAGLRIEPLAVAPGATSPAADELDRVALLAKTLADRPGLGLELRGRSDVEDDPALAERMLIEMVVANAELPPVDAGFLEKRRVRGALEDRGEGRRGELGPEDAQTLARWIEAVEVPAARRNGLARERAMAVRDALVESHGVSPDRLRIGDPLTGPPAVLIQLAPVGH